MAADDLGELRDPSNWEIVGEQLRQPVKSPRAVVFVALSRDELSKIAAMARRHGMKTGEFIRTAALAFRESDRS